MVRSESIKTPTKVGVFIFYLESVFLVGSFLSSVVALGGVGFTSSIVFYLSIL